MQRISLNGSMVIKDNIPLEAGSGFHIEIDRFTNLSHTHFDMHYELEIGIVLSGRIQRHYADTLFELKAGQIWLSGIWEPHGLKILEAPSEVAIFFIHPDSMTGLDSIFGQGIDLLAPFFSPPRKRPQIRDGEDSKIRDIGRRAKEIYQETGKNRQLMEKLITLELLTRIQDNWVNDTLKTSSRIKNYSKINPALNLIFHNRNLIPLKQAAQACGLNEKTFTRTFKEVMGHTFSQYALGYRIRASLNDLLKEGSSIKNLCYKWGFSSESHYNRLFNKFYGCNPGEYRKSHAPV